MKFINEFIKFFISFYKIVFGIIGGLLFILRFYLFVILVAVVLGFPYILAELYSPYYYFLFIITIPLSMFISKKYSEKVLA